MATEKELCGLTDVQDSIIKMCFSGDPVGEECARQAVVEILSKLLRADEPSDAEIHTLASAFLTIGDGDTEHDQCDWLGFARALLSRYASPLAISGEVPQFVIDALKAWTGAEPSQSVLARAVDEWLGAVPATDDSAKGVEEMDDLIGLIEEYGSAKATEAYHGHTFCKRQPAAILKEIRNRLGTVQATHQQRAYDMESWKTQALLAVGYLCGQSRSRKDEVKAQLVSLIENPPPVSDPPRGETDAAVAAIQFALETDEGMEWLRCWNEGDFDACRREWPETPAACFIGADPQHPATRAVMVGQPTGSDTVPRHVAETLADAIYKAAQRAGIANSDHASLSVAQCLHLLDCMVPTAALTDELETLRLPSNWKSMGLRLFGKESVASTEQNQTANVSPNASSNTGIRPPGQRGGGQIKN